MLGNGNSSTLTYNFGGGAAGIDYRIDPRFLVGIGAGYTRGQPVGRQLHGPAAGRTRVSATALRLRSRKAAFYADALAGYAYSNNQMQRQIIIPGLQPRTANGSTGANQFLGQVETGYKVPVFAPAVASVTPFARLQTSSVNQAGFSEWGANSLEPERRAADDELCALDLRRRAGRCGIWRPTTRTLGLTLRLGWLHEYAYTARPITAAFAGAPSNSFTVYGATPQARRRGDRLLGQHHVDEATPLYLRYDGGAAPTPTTTRSTSACG